MEEPGLKSASLGVGFQKDSLRPVSFGHLGHLLLPFKAITPGSYIERETKAHSP
jgi:hypothetical protein